MNTNPYKIFVSYFILILLLFFEIGLAFTPKPNSPLARHVHPRIHITPDDLPKMREVIATEYKNRFQDYVNWAASANDHDDTNNISEIGHDKLRAVMVHQAFIAALGKVDGISYPISLESYARRAINRLKEQLDAGKPLSYVAVLVYDWTFNYMSENERKDIAQTMSTRRINTKNTDYDYSVANPNFTPQNMFSSKYFSACYPYYVALALWGDGYVDEAADKALDTFYDTMLNFGYLDAQNFVADDEGGWAEWIGYATHNPRAHYLNVDAWRTATGEDYIAENTIGNAIKNYPKFITYMIDPHKYFNRTYTFIRMGGAETTDPSLEHGELRQQIYIVPRLLAKSNLKVEAGLQRRFIEKYEVKWPEYEHFYLWGFLGLHRSVDSVTPEQLNLPLSIWSRNIGIFLARTGFESSADGVFAAIGSHYRFEGHQGAPEHPGFILAKYGELVNSRHVAHRGYGNLNNYPGAHEWNLVFFEKDVSATHNYIGDQSDLKKAYNGDMSYEWGGIEQVTRKNGVFYHVYHNFNRTFKAPTTHTRDYVWLPGSTPDNDSDYLVVYDRVHGGSKAHWIYHVPWKPKALNFSSVEDITTGSGTSDRIGSAYLGQNIIIKELNGLGGEQDNEGGTLDYTGGADAHGVAFCQTLFPKDIRVEVSRVAKFDDQVIKRQHDLAIKSSRWQIDVASQEFNPDQTFLHVFQTNDANKTVSMAPISLIEVGNAMQGVWIQRESANRSNFVVLFNKTNQIDTNTVTYSITGNGSVKQIIIGLKPYTIYTIKDLTNGTSQNKGTEPNMEFWKYKDGSKVEKRGVLYFESNISGTHTFQLTPSGEQDKIPPSKPSNLHLK